MLGHTRFFVICLLCGLACLTARAEAAAPAAVVCAKAAPFAEKLAAKEVRRYVYLRTGKLLPIVNDLKAAPQGGAILIGSGTLQA
jgi:hypothetical protein